jgi:LacI family repressor for deo operon, udp, cdd, tsx, nupC, and nupG
MADASDSPTARRDRATIEDVALAAGVSVATVSRALRGLPNVAESTRIRVRETAIELRYRADPAASRLATGRSRSIAVAVPLLNGWYFSHVVAGVEAVCAEAGYDTIVIGLAGKSARHGFLRDDECLDRRADGLIVVDVSLPEADIERIHALGLRLVSVGPELTGSPSTGIDDIAVGELATCHLLELGHHRIGLIGGTTVDPYEFIVPHLRRQGFERAHVRASLDPDPDLSAIGDFTVQGGYDAGVTLLRRAARPSAIFVQSDEMAFGVLHAARDLGIAVPGEVSVIGVDDHDVSAAMGLTTVHQDVEEHGARAARLMIDLLDGVEVDFARHDEPIRLVLRSSTGPAPS